MREHLLRPSRPAPRQVGGIEYEPAAPLAQHRAGTAVCRGGFDPSRRCEREFPIFDEQSRSGVSRFRRQRAEAALRSSTGIAELLPHRLRQRASRRLSAQRPLDRAGSRRRARRCGPCSTPPTRPRDRVRARRDRGDQPRRAELGPGHPRSRRRDRRSASSSTTRTSCRGSMLRDRLGAQAGRRADRRRPASSTWPRFEALLSPRTRLVAVTHVSNVTGATLPVETHHRAGPRGRRRGRRGRRRAGGPAHLAVDVAPRSAATSTRSPATSCSRRPARAWWGRRAPRCSRRDARVADRRRDGGRVSTEGHARFREPPHRFEAGTPNIAGVIRLGARDATLSRGSAATAIREHEEALTGYAVDRLSRIPGVDWSCPADSGGSACFRSMSRACTRTMSAPVLDRHNVAVRVGHHCAQPLMEKLGLAGTVRASLGVYNDESRHRPPGRGDRGLPGDVLR